MFIEVCWVPRKKSFETNQLCFRFCHSRLYFCLKMPLSTYCWWIWISSCNLVKLLQALNKACIVKRYCDMWNSHQEWTRVFEWVHVIDCNFQSVIMIVVVRLFGFFWWSFVTFVNAFVLLNTYCPGLFCRKWMFFLFLALNLSMGNAYFILRVTFLVISFLIKTFVIQWNVPIRQTLFKDLEDWFFLKNESSVN